MLQVLEIAAPPLPGTPPDALPGTCASAQQTPEVAEVAEVARGSKWKPGHGGRSGWSTDRVTFSAVVGAWAASKGSCSPTAKVSCCVAAILQLNT